MQVVYILLEVYPIYRVDYQFMMGLLVAVSKELPLMTEELLQGVYYICSTFRKLTLHAIKDNPL